MKRPQRATRNGLLADQGWLLLEACHWACLPGVQASSVQVERVPVHDLHEIHWCVAFEWNQEGVSNWFRVSFSDNDAAYMNLADFRELLNLEHGRALLRGPVPDTGKSTYYHRT